MTTIIYHEVRKGIACPDGFLAAYIVAQQYRNSKVIGCVYGDQIPIEVEDGEAVVIVDFSFTNLQLEGLADRGCKVTVLDHHKTAWENLQNLSARIRAKYDVIECGASLAWRHYHPHDPEPALVEYVRDRDLWLHQLPLTHEIHTAVGHLGRTFDTYSVLIELDQKQLGLLLGGLGAKLLAEKQKLVEEIADRAEVIQIDEYNVPGVYLTEAEGCLTSDICAHLYTVIFPDEPFVCCITFEGTYSLRSSKESNFDVSKIAKRHNGGGHKHSAGFTPLLM